MFLHQKACIFMVASQTKLTGFEEEKSIEKIKEY